MRGAHGTRRALLTVGGRLGKETAQGGKKRGENSVKYRSLFREPSTLNYTMYCSSEIYSFSHQLSDMNCKSKSLPSSVNTDVTIQSKN